MVSVLRHSPTFELQIWLVACALCLSTGCARCRLPALDPSGDRIFLPSPAYTRLAAPPQRSVLPHWPRPAWQAPADPAECYSARPVGWYDEDDDGPGLFDPDCRPWWCDDDDEEDEGLSAAEAYQWQYPGYPNDPCAPYGYTPVYPAASTTPLVPVYPQPASVAPQPPGIVRPDTVPQFPISASPAPGPLVGESSRNGPPWSDQYAARLSLTPTQVVAPVGREVVLRAGLCESEGFLLKRQRIEWSLSQDSVGTIVEVDQNDSTWLRHIFHRAPRKQSGNYALGLTSSEPQLLTQGTLDPNDDLWILEGQTWISLTSSAEGASHVTAVAPSAAGWDDRRQSATIYWVDGRWVVPPPVISGSSNGQVITTRVVRATTGVPVEGWRVRYEITGGTPAGLDANGAQAVEVVTDATGNAAATVTPQQPTGQTQVRIQVVRTGSTPGDLPRYVVNDSTSTIQWTGIAGPPPQIPPGPSNPVPPSLPSSPTIPLVTVNAPIEVPAGSTVPLRIDVTNPGTMPMLGVELANPIPAGAQYVGSAPLGDLLGDRVRWQLGDLQPGQTQQVRLDLRIDGPGPIQDCAVATSAQGANGQGCVAIQVGAAAASQLDLSVTGPDTATLGQEIAYQITVTNRGTIPLERVLVKDRFDNGLRHARAEGRNAIEWSLSWLAAGESRTAELRFIPVQVGRQCHEVTVTSGGGAGASRNLCVEVANTGGYIPPGTQPPTAPGDNNYVPPLPPDPGTAPGNPGNVYIPPGSTNPPSTTDPGTPGSPGNVYVPPANAESNSAPAGALLVEMQGPTTAMVGQQVTYRVRVSNRGNVPQTVVRLTYDFNPAIQPTQTTPGVVRVGDQFIWNIPVLDPQRYQEFTVVAVVATAGTNICHTSAAQSAEGERHQASVCVEVANGPGGSARRPALRSADTLPRPVRELSNVAQYSEISRDRERAAPPAPIPAAKPIPDPADMARQFAEQNLRVEISDLGDPAPVQGALTYVISIWNPREVSDQNVTLQVTLPPGARYESSLNPPGIQLQRRSAEGATLQFTPIAELRPRETALFRIIVRPTTAGSGRITAQATSRRIPEGVSVDEESSFFAN